MGNLPLARKFVIFFQFQVDLDDYMSQIFFLDEQCFL